MSLPSASTRQARSRPYRVIQWATGAVGTEVLATIVDHRSDLELVGVKVYSGEKNGVDAGVLAVANESALRPLQTPTRCSRWMLTA